ncbi:MAG: acyltransferase family protein [Cellulosilyticaceae bacterium]
MKKRLAINMDMFRVFLALLVVAIHGIKVDDAITFYVVNGIARIAVPLFFILTGITLRHEKLQEWEHITRYIGNQVKIFLPWILLYLCIAGYSFMNSGNILYGGSLFIQFWFVSATWIALILLHVLLKKFTLRQILFIALVLHIFGIFGDAYLGVTQQIPILSTFYEWFLGIFFKTRSGVCFGLFYMTLGMYFHEKQLWIKRSNTWLGIGIALTLVMQYVEITLLQRTQTPHYNMYFTLIPLTVLIMSYLKNNESKKKGLLNYKKISVQIYITHTLLLFMVSSYYGSFFTGRAFLPVVGLYIVGYGSFIGVKYGRRFLRA